MNMMKYIYKKFNKERKKEHKYKFGEIMRTYSQ